MLGFASKPTASGRKDRTHLASVKYPTIDYQDIIYYSAVTAETKLNGLEEVDPTLLELCAQLAFPV